MVHCADFRCTYKTHVEREYFYLLLGPKSEKSPKIGSRGESTKSKNGVAKGSRSKAMVNFRSFNILDPLAKRLCSDLCSDLGPQRPNDPCSKSAEIATHRHMCTCMDITGSNYESVLKHAGSTYLLAVKLCSNESNSLNLRATSHWVDPYLFEANSRRWMCQQCDLMSGEPLGKGLILDLCSNLYLMR